MRLQFEKLFETRRPKTTPRSPHRLYLFPLSLKHQHQRNVVHCLTLKTKQGGRNMFIKIKNIKSNPNSPSRDQILSRCSSQIGSKSQQIRKYTTSSHLCTRTRSSNNQRLSFITTCSKGNDVITSRQLGKSMILRVPS